MRCRVRFENKWQLVATPADAFKNPSELSGSNLDWSEIEAPSTAAACLRAAGQWCLDLSPRRFDAEDWWYRIGFYKPSLAERELLFLGFDGLATVAEVWFNGAALFSSDNMFIAH